MAGASGDSKSNISTLLQNQPLDAFFFSASSPSFLGSRSMLSFEDVNRGDRSNRSLIRSFDHSDYVEDDLEEYFHQPGKKRRLTVDQVKFLERSFEVENKLEPDRKVQLAKDLGLQPRQVAIWFQNRRARWKTKQLESDYEVLLASYDTLKADYGGLLAEKEKLRNEVDLLKNKLDVNGNGTLELSDTAKNTAELGITSAVDSGLEGDAPSKQEDISSAARSDIFDSDSPRYADGLRLETCDSSYVFGQDQSDLSQDEEDNLSMFPELEHSEYSEPPAASFEDSAFWAWSF